MLGPTERWIQEWLRWHLAMATILNACPYQNEIAFTVTQVVLE